MTKVNTTLLEPNTDKSYQILQIDGEIDRESIVHFKETVEQLIGSFEQKNLVLDLGNLMFINSEGIGYITDIYNRLATQNKKLIIIKASTRIMDIFNLVGLDSLIPCFASEEEAAATF